MSPPTHSTRPVETLYWLERTDAHVGRLREESFKPSSYLGPYSYGCSAVSPLKWLFAGGLRCKLRSYDWSARVTTTKHRKQTLAPLFWAGPPDLEANIRMRYCALSNRPES